MRSKRWPKVVLGVLVLIVVSGMVLFGFISKKLEKLVSEPISAVNLMSVEDGEYVGEYDAFPVNAKVRVDIRGHRIEHIEILEHGNGQGYGAEIITESIMKEQSLSVDLISGATYSSVVILKAVEDALTDLKED